MLSRGFAARPRACCFFGVLYFRAHSQRETWVSRSTPHGFAYCKGSREQRVGSPTGQYLRWAVYLLLFVLVSHLLGPRVQSRTGSSQQSTTLWLRLAPSATPWCYPMSDARRVYLVDSFIVRGSQSNAHTKSLIPRSVWSHLQRLAVPILMVESRRLFAILHSDQEH